MLSLLLLLLFLHEGSRLVPGSTSSPPGPGCSVGNTAVSNMTTAIIADAAAAAVAAAKRGNRRLTRNESRYHSGE